MERYLEQLLMDITYATENVSWPYVFQGIYASMIAHFIFDVAMFSYLKRATKSGNQEE